MINRTAKYTVRPAMINKIIPQIIVFYSTLKSAFIVIAEQCPKHECIIRTGYGAAAQTCFQFFSVATGGIATKNPPATHKAFSHRPQL